MVDRGYNVALARKIFTQVTDQEAIARVAVRDDNQRIARIGTARLRISNRSSGKSCSNCWIASYRLILTAWLLACRQLGWIPYLNRKTSIVDSTLAAAICIQDIDSIGVDKFQRPNTNIVITEARQFWRIRSYCIDSIFLGYQAGSHTHNQYHYTEAPHTNSPVSY